MSATVHVDELSTETLAPVLQVPGTTLPPNPVSNDAPASLKDFADKFVELPQTPRQSYELKIDSEFKCLIPNLLAEELNQLEVNLLQDGCQDPLSVWIRDGETFLVDGHNRYAICRKHNLSFSVVEVELKDKNHAKLWIGERQLGRRNLTDDQRSIIANEVREWRSSIAVMEQAKVARAAVSARNPISPEKRADGKAKSAQPSEPTRAKVAKEAKLSERKLRLAQEIKKVDPTLSEMVRSGEVKLTEAKKLANLPVAGRAIAIEEINIGIDVRTAIRTAKKENYNATVAKEQPKALEGKYRIILADPPWKYVGLNQADEYGHAERHYDCLDDEQLKAYKPGKGSRLVKDLADENSVLFLWVTAPLMERCFPIIHAWGFEYKTQFIWYKLKHTMGHYNSVRHEHWLICTKGSCTPDVAKLFDSVQSIERSNKHSQKPKEFVQIIESLYDHGRKLELFCREPRAGWDFDGNEV